MTRARIGSFLGFLSIIALGTAMAITPVQAKPDDEERNDNEEEIEALSDPLVQGIVMAAQWVDGRSGWTAMLRVWSIESDRLVNVYGDGPGVKEKIANGTACVGRFVVAVGDRIDDDELSALSLEVPNLTTPCTSTIGPTP